MALSREEAVTLARQYAHAQSLVSMQDPPSYLPKTAEEAGTFEPHTWVIGAIIGASEKNTTIDKVREFHHAFGHSVSSYPTEATPELRKLRVDLIFEEAIEFAKAMGVDVILHYQARSGTHYTSAHADNAEVDLVEAADALGDIDYVVAGAALVLGIPHNAVVDAIQESNMSKLGEDGKPIYREDGKILKGPNYKPPTEQIRALLVGAIDFGV